VQGPQGIQGPAGPATPLPDRLAAYSSTVAQAQPDTTTATGWYIAANGATTNPTASDYLLEVIGWNSDFVTQFAHWFYGNVTYKRFKAGGAWTAWLQTFPTVVNDTTLPPRLQTIPALWTGDLNSAVQNGWYAHVPDATNAPVGGQYGMVLVSVLNVPTNVKQLWFSYSDDAVWQRRIQDGSWRAWVKVYPIDDTNLPSRLRSQTGSIPITDCNAGTLSGWYSVAGAVTNGPPGATPGHLEVYSWDVAGSVIVQFYHEYSGYKSWKRFMWGGWTAWVQIYPVDDTNLPVRIQSAASAVSDWNSAVSNGYYYSGGVPNAPVQGYWLMGHVIKTLDGYVTQEVWMRDFPNKYARTYGPSGWSKWQKLFECAVAGYIRKVIGGAASGTFDGNGLFNVSFGRTVAGVVGVVVTNNHSGQLNVDYSAMNFSTTGFQLAGWNINNTPAANQGFAISWMATVDE